jgi:DNA (cytosine-5)-methyltransferase 1
MKIIIARSNAKSCQKKTKNGKDRAETVRLSQAARRKRLEIKTITVEVDKKTHGNLKEIADEQHTTLQELLSTTLKTIVKSSDTATRKDRPWDVFAKPDKSEDKNKKLTHVSLFSGCGGIDLGFHQAGFRTVFANDIDTDACETYRKNVGDISNEDIRLVEIPKLESRPDVLTAGFPCQPFSNAGSRRGLEDERGNLYQTAIDFVENLKPRSIVFENVRGLLSFKSNGGEPLIAEICKKLDNLGYHVVFSLLDASHHNVPQKRLRVFIVGIEKTSDQIFTFPKPCMRDDLTLGNTILDVPDGTHNQNEILRLSPQSAKLNLLVPEGGSWKDVQYNDLPLRMKKIRDNMQRYHSPNFYRRFHRDEIAGTITAAFTPENAGILHPTEKRAYSVRESARIQSFPDWFEFAGKHIKSKYKQIGNAVPPRLAYEVAVRLRDALAGKKQSNRNDFITFKQFMAAGKPLRACDRDVIFSSEQI